MDFSNVLRRAWEITWKHKGLWVLGILASCSSNYGSGSSNFSNTFQYNISGGEYTQIDRWFQSIPEETWIAIGITALCVFVLMAIVIWVLTAIGNGGLIAGFQMAETGETVTLGTAFQQGVSYFWKLLVIQLIPGLLSLLILGPVIFGMFLCTFLTLGLGIICLLPLLCILVPLGIAIGVYTMLAQIALIVEDLDIATAFQRAWEVFRSNLGEIIVMGLILVVGGFVVGLILAIPFILIALPLMTGLIMGTESSSVVGVSVTVIGGLLYLPILIIASGIIRTFVTGSWTLTYRSLIGANAE